MKARIAKKLLMAVLSGSIEVLPVPAGGALLMKFDPRRACFAEKTCRAIAPSALGARQLNGSNREPPATVLAILGNDAKT